MLLSLSIKNYALIEHLEVDFSNQFSIITGETGAGKSILLGALGLVLGNRADLSSLKDDQQKCVIEAQFQLSKYQLQTVFESNDLDYDDNTIIRREILPTGKSRAFVNDSPVNLQQLQELATYLIDIHSQNETRALVNEAYQIEVLDLVAQNEAFLKQYQNELKQYKLLQKQYNQLVSDKDSLVKEQEYNRFLLEELLQANLTSGEQELLEEELEKLSNVEFIKENLDKILAVANEEQIGLLSLLSETKQAFGRIQGFSTSFKDLSERINSIGIEFQDVLDETFRESDKIINDPERLEWVQNKLQAIYNLQKKHQVTSVDDLLIIQNQLDDKVVLVDELDTTIQKLEQEIASQLEKVKDIANLISDQRKKVAPKLTAEMEVVLTQLGMPDAQLVFDFQKANSFLSTGNDLVILQFSANKGMPLGTLKKVASGGEMSRIMLALKAVLANYSNLPTIIFDEIDTGVSGEIAIKMGEIMKTMSQRLQVFAITHLPQIAAKGNQHYKVFKFNQGETTISELKQLSENERITEIAEMLSGKAITDSAIVHAKALLN
ncbi:DNA repair protein RecN [Flavobacterium tibetense]|uniref:DNA repair protein RecN n=1 Tax=Flavobacterium tibetense TaxID=2233533 RepID=A0A365P0W7_9FLAO|nr:DNA repair protein RecN [Flavobacterium tibetense]RBA28137.1 DNA repair protein RecN [Flavobacterium tibetense]